MSCRYSSCHIRPTLPPPYREKLYQTEVQMNNHQYKVNLNSMRSINHVREVCLRFTKNLC
ncbi:putative translational regulatory protein ArgL, partial [Salmonella enterica]|uniref:putative translational regulatory protein ArgL n=1 Tax=Salmonella enterica TaxID=28901 RepID=UPI00398C2C5D